MNLTFRIFHRFVDLGTDTSCISKLRSQRWEILKRILSPILKPVTILDLGGTEQFWAAGGLLNDPTVNITLLNLYPIDATATNVTSVIGDARDLRQYRDQEFDLVCSNSVIEHVGTFEDQKKMASEIRRVGKRHFLQTPNFYFPFEPHFLVPFFQFFPQRLQIFLLRHFSLGWLKRQKNVEDAISVINSIRLLKREELEFLFPDSSIVDEKLCGLTYSFLVCSDSSQIHGP